MFCTQCGKEIREGLKYCTQCGAPVKISSDVSSDKPDFGGENSKVISENVENQYSDTKPLVENTQLKRQVETTIPKTTSTNKTEKKAGKGIVIAIIFLVILIIAVAGAAFWTLGGKDLVLDMFPQFNTTRTVGSTDSAEEDVNEERISNSAKEVEENTDILDESIKNSDEKKIIDEFETEKDETKKDEAEKDATEKDEIEKEEAKKNEIKKEEAEKDEIKKEEAEKDEIKKDEIKKDEIKKDETKKDKLEKDEKEKDIAEELAEETMSEYILEDSDIKYITIDDLEGFDADTCRLARNELYARRGRKFDDVELQAYFDNLDWYHGTMEAKDFQESMLNDFEVANRDLIIEYEKEMGYREGD